MSGHLSEPNVGTDSSDQLQLARPPKPSSSSEGTLPGRYGTFPGRLMAGDQKLDGAQVQPGKGKARAVNQDEAEN